MVLDTRTPPSPPAWVHVGCKVNLNLWLTAVRPNGWHELDSLFVPLNEPHDVLHVERAQPAAPAFSMSCTEPDVDVDNNTLTKAYAAYAAAAGGAPALRVHLEKGIPHGAGLGGGSADAAALLLWMQAAACCEQREPLTPAALDHVAVQVGADVPFFLRGTPCRATGIGELLTPCALPLAGWQLVLVCPPERVSTPWAYRAWDTAQADNAHTLSGKLLTSTPTHDTHLLSDRAVAACAGLVMINSFEPVVFAAFPSLRACKTALVQDGAQGVVMSGSGASLVGLFRHRAEAEAACAHLLDQGIRAYRHALS